MDDIFYGEVGVDRRRPLIVRNGMLDDEYDPDNPPGFDTTRRNYDHNLYWSGMGDAEPEHFRLT